MVKAGTSPDTQTDGACIVRSLAMYNRSNIKLPGAASNPSNAHQQPTFNFIVHCVYNVASLAKGQWKAKVKMDGASLI